ncbi:uncharacterized protein LOC103315412 [Nasonia vitripennis]|uniref:Reverse transcriptase n=1 Tax=Nasonia vitripennis TaxID=7425 RepID=A0A7M7H221_NASVI|nr:uncharacterized protein LOC103315412 [Nasonia vitripennis]
MAGCWISCGTLVKIFMRIHSEEDVERLRADLNALSGWACENVLVINADKSQVASFYRGRTQLQFQYELDGSAIARTEVVRDLGVLFDSRLTFALYADHVVSRCGLIGFVKRTTRDFSNISAITYLYNTLVMPTFIYCCQIWSPYTQIAINHLDSVQHKFIRYLA